MLPEEFEKHCVICKKCEAELKRSEPNRKVNDRNLCKQGVRILIIHDPRIKALLPNLK